MVGEGAAASRRLDDAGVDAQVEKLEAVRRDARLRVELVKLVLLAVRLGCPCASHAGYRPEMTAVVSRCAASSGCVTLIGVLTPFTVTAGAENARVICELFDRTHAIEHPRAVAGASQCYSLQVDQFKCGYRVLQVVPASQDQFLYGVAAFRL